MAIPKKCKVSVLEEPRKMVIHEVVRHFQSKP